MAVYTLSMQYFSLSIVNFQAQVHPEFRQAEGTFQNAPSPLDCLRIKNELPMAAHY
jgi:hypothetical protein